MNPLKIRRQWKVTYQYGLDGIRRELNLSALVVSVFAVIFVCIFLLAVLYLSGLRGINSNQKALAKLQKENVLLRQKVESYSATIDTIYQKLDSLKLINQNTENTDKLYPYSSGDDESFIDNTFVYDSYLDARVNALDRQILQITACLNPDPNNADFSTGELVALGNGPSIYPTFGRWSDGWGVRLHPFKQSLYFHHGVDIANKMGTPIYATGDGEVVLTGYDQEYGKIIKLKHANNYETRYGHLYTFMVAIGDQVRKGQIIALMGSTGMSTGPHLHYEVLVNGGKVNPARYLNRIEEPVYYAKR